MRVIGPEGEQLGLLDTREAVRQAQEKGLDLVQVADKADPPVCKIMDYGKFKYQEKKKAQASKKKQVTSELKEIQIRPKTENHDLEHKAKRAIGFLEDGNKVKVIVFYRGREMEHLDVGWVTLQEYIQKMEGAGMIDLQPKMEGKRLVCIIAPISPAKKKQAENLVGTLIRPRIIRDKDSPSNDALGASGASGPAIPLPKGAAGPAIPTPRGSESDETDSAK